RILYQNRAHKDLFGDHVGELCYTTYRQRESVCEDCPLAMSFENGRIHKVERSLITNMGVLHIAITASSLKNAQGEIIAGIEVVRDVTKRKETEEMLELERRQLLSIFDSIDEVIYISDPDTYDVLYANMSLKKELGDIVGQKCYKALQGMDSPCPFCTNDRIFGKNEGKSYIWEFQNRINNRWYRCIDKAVRWPDGRMVRYEMAIDVTGRKKTEESLKESEDKYRILVENIQDGVFIIQDAKAKFVNEAFAKMVGYTVEELIGMDIRRVIAPEDLDTVMDRYRRRLMGEDVPKEYEFRMLHKDGATRVFVNMLVGLVDYQDKAASMGTVKDITERKKMEEERQKAQRIESLGILAGGIAHDFNNILTAITGNISLAKMYAKPGLEVFDILTEVEKASLRAKNLTKQLLTFSKGGTPIKKTIQVTKLIKDSAGFALSGSNIRCEFSIPDIVWPVDVDEGQISQVINNLIINAQQAMPGGGIINIIAENIDSASGCPIPLKEGKYVKITIQDHGIGIPEEHLHKIFDPYFSTKQEGSGLGLATAYSIIKKHDGYITAESKLGIGTTFYICLPVSEGKIPEAKKMVETFPPGKERGRILVMDDEEIVRIVIGRMLGQCGYEADYAGDGTGAIELYKNAKESGKPFDAVILDLIIPAGVGGKEAIKRLLEIDPDVKAIVSSGYSDDPVMSDFKKYGFRDALAKPYEIAELRRALHGIIVGKDR
ncbi:MAG: PAS domain S-box protein, partial [Nitrospirae bacterium]|nr:PAS domain S-box protein [Nitrospirota bacterium]